MCGLTPNRRIELMLRAAGCAALPLMHAWKAVALRALACACASPPCVLLLLLLAGLASGCGLARPALAASRLREDDIGGMRA